MVLKQRLAVSLTQFDRFIVFCFFKVALPKDGAQAKIGGQSYTIRRIEPAKNADVVSVAKAMNREQFAPMLKNVFQPEVDATHRAFETGVYVR